MNQKEYYKVLTDNTNYWISESELIKVTKGIPMSELAVCDLEVDDKIVKGERYYKVSMDLFVCIRDNTNNPKLYPKGKLIETKGKKSENKQSENQGAKTR